MLNGADWQKKSKTSPCCGFIDDADTVPAGQRRTKEHKTAMVALTLGQIANYCPVISHHSIVRNSTSIDNIWQVINLHYGFQCTGAHFIDFAAIRREPDERPEDLYHRLMVLTDDNLLRKDSGVTHIGAAVTEDEELTSSLCCPPTALPHFCRPADSACSSEEVMSLMQMCRQT